LESLKTPWINRQQDALQSLFYALFTQKKIGGQPKHRLVAYSFLTLYSYNVDGTLKACNSFTQYFSKVVFFGRAAVFNSIMSTCKAEDLGFFE